MSGLKKQVLSNAIDILLNQGNLPEKLDGKKLYGEALEGDDALKADCRVYQLSNGTGNGQITVYQVFNGIELYYNDIHLAYCNQDQVTAKNIIEINHCYIGRYECSFGENTSGSCTEAETDRNRNRIQKRIIQLSESIRESP